ncbi:MAG: 16S rRNA (cytosine(967)-C(5))-methyltransferase RsmB [Kiritimatiellia bacterium]|jgi:16S rRNA (cytosine967-C5)-methyltransferase
MIQNTGVESRRAAIFALSRWLATGEFPDRLIAASSDHGFVMDLVYGCARRRRELEWMLAQCVKRMPSGETRAALLVGALQILHRPSIPGYAAIFATVEAAKLASRRSAGFVNGVLRSLLRRREELRQELEKQSLGIRTSHPDVLVKRWVERFGGDEAARLCAWNNEPASTCLACLPGRDAPDAVLAALDAAGVQAVPHSARPDCLVLPHGVPPTSLPGFAEGRFVVQDPATLDAIGLLDLAPGQNVLDACAAPGGKTVQIAARLRNSGSLLALDVHGDRLALLHENLARFGFESFVRCGVGDAADPRCEALEDHAFDRILLDVPCSNTGVLCRRPDARWRFSLPRLAKLRAVQSALLRANFARLRPGGRLVYSTCSLEPEENRLLVDEFLAGEPAARLVGTTERIPTRDDTDGAFAAAIIRD